MGQAQDAWPIFFSITVPKTGGRISQTTDVNWDSIPELRHSRKLVQEQRLKQLHNMDEAANRVNVQETTVLKAGFHAVI